MKLWIKKTLIGVFGVSIVLGGLTACSSGRLHGGPMSAEKIAQARSQWVERVGRKLDLDGVQKQKLNALADQLEAQRTALMGNTTDARAELQAIVADEKFDRSRAQALVEEKVKAVQASSPDVITALADFYDSLNLGQQQKVRELMQRRGKGWMHNG